MTGITSTVVTAHNDISRLTSQSPNRHTYAPPSLDERSKEGSVAPFCEPCTVHALSARSVPAWCAMTLTDSQAHKPDSK